METLLTSGCHLGQLATFVRMFHTLCVGALITAAEEAFTGALS